VTQRFLFLRRVTPLFRFCGAELCVFESLSRRSFFAAWRPFCFAMQRFLFFHPVTPLFLFAARSSVFCGTSLHSFFLQRGALCFLPRCVALSSQGMPVASLCGTLCFSLHHTAVCSCSVVLSVALLRSALCFCITGLFSCHGAICSGALKLWGGVLFFCSEALFLLRCCNLSFALRCSFICNAALFLLRRNGHSFAAQHSLFPHRATMLSRWLCSALLFAPWC